MPGRSCAECEHLVSAPDALERHVPGLNILSSAYGAVRAETALCRRRGVFIVPGPACAEFRAAARAACGPPA